MFILKILELQDLLNCSAVLTKLKKFTMDASERRKVSELLNEMRYNADEVKSTSHESGLKWMYKGPSDLIDREEYLLGKSIDKTFEELNNGGNTDLVGRTGEQTNMPKRLLEKTDNTEQVDIAKKILEDPLYAIKQKEMEARRKLLNNPVKLKQIKQMLLERSKQNNANIKGKKKKLKKKSEEYLNLLIIKKLKKFSDKEKRKALKKIMKSDSKSSSSSVNNYKNKHKSRRKRLSSSDSSDSSNESSNSDDYKKNFKQKKRRKKEIEEKKRKSSSSSNCSDSSDSELEKKKKHKKLRKSDNSENESSVDSGSKKDRKPKHKRRNIENRHRIREKDIRGKGKDGRKDDSEDRKRNKSYGLMMPDGSKPEMKRRSPVRKFERRIETKTKYVPQPQSKPLSEKEREEKLKEMVKNAKLRKEDREKNLANHRKKELMEEESKAYDDDFMRRQMKHLTSQGTMADRIKSNINNIQRSKSSMDSNFMRK